MDTEALCHICEELHKQTAVTATPGKNLVTNIFNYICCEYRHLKGIKWTTDKTGIPLKMDMVETTFSAIVAKCGITEPKIAVNALLEKGEHFIIRDIFRLYLRGMGYDYIQKSLKQKGYQTANGNDFSKSAINSILKNQKYMGTYVYDRTESKDSESRRKHNTFRFPTACRQSFRKKISKKHKRTCERMQPNRPIELGKTTML